MKTLLRINLLLIFKPNLLCITTGLFLLLSLVHVPMAHSLINTTDADIWDYLLLSLGGLPFHCQIWMMFGWIGAIAPLLFFSYHLAGVTSSFDQFVLNRIGSRAKWWTAKFFAAILLAFFYSIWYFLLHFLIGICFFSIHSAGNQLIHLQNIQVLTWAQNPVFFMACIWFFLTTGLIAFVVLAQAVTLFFRKSSTAYVLYTIFVFVTGFAYLQGVSVKELTPLMYPSLLDLLQQQGHEITAFVRTFVFDLIFTVVCFWVCRLKIRNVTFSMDQ